MTHHPICFKCAEGAIATGAFVKLYAHFGDAMATHIQRVPTPQEQIEAWVQSGGSVGVMRLMWRRKLASAWCPDSVAFCNPKTATELLRWAARNASLDGSALAAHKHLRIVSRAHPNVLRNFGSSWLRWGRTTVVEAHARQLVSSYGISPSELPGARHGRERDKQPHTWCGVAETQLRLGAWALNQTVVDLYNGFYPGTPPAKHPFRALNMSLLRQAEAKQPTPSTVNLTAQFDRVHLLRSYMVGREPACVCHWPSSL